MALEFYQNHFRPVIEAKRNDTVSKTPAHDHVRVPLGIQTIIVLWKQSLIWCNQPTDQGQPELTAMCVPGENQIHSGTPVEGTIGAARRTANCMNRRPFADEKIVSETSGTHNESTTNNFYITGADPNAIADAVDRKLQFKAGRRKATWA